MSDISNIIKQIQVDIISSNSNLQSVLLKSKVLAYQLNSDEFKHWVRSELDGYARASDVPEYRVIKTHITGTLFNGTWKYSNIMVPMLGLPQEMQDGHEDVRMTQGVLSLEEMAKEKQFYAPMPSAWIELYNYEQSVNRGGFQLIEANRCITGVRITHILGAIRSRLQDFILEISSFNWDMDREPILSERIEKIFQVTINNHAREINMSSLEQNGDTYNVGQAGAVGKYARSDANTFMQSQQDPALAEVVNEILRLLQQLEQKNPSATEIEKITYINDETTPSFKRRAIGALKAGGETAIDEFVLESKPLKVIKSIFKGWLQPE